MSGRLLIVTLTWQLLHPILEALVHTEYEWIQHLVVYFNTGDIGKFESLAVKFPQEVSPVPRSDIADGTSRSSQRMPISCGKRSA